MPGLLLGQGDTAVALAGWWHWARIPREAAHEQLVLPPIKRVGLDERDIVWMATVCRVAEDQAGRRGQHSHE